MRWILVLLVSVGLSAQSWSYGAFEQITVAGTAIGFTASAITPTTGGPQATVAVCYLETNEVRYTVDGTTPTSTVGTIWSVGTTMTFVSHNVLMQFRAIRTGSSGQLDCTYFGN